MKKRVMMEVGLCCLGFIACVYGFSKITEPYLEEAMASNTKTVMKEKREKVIYLTFDDGPSKNTEAVLQVLAKYKVKATFFVTGAEPDYAKFIKQAYEEGHGLGIHSFSHNYKEIYEGEAAYLEDFRKTSDLIFDQTGHTTTFFRFPGGSSNTVSRRYSPGIITALTKELTDNGYQYYDWNASCGDGNSHFGSGTLVSQAIREAKGKDEVMMLLHDGTGNKATVNALPQIIEYFQEEGYQFKVIDNDTSVFHHHIAN